MNTAKNLQQQEDENENNGQLLWSVRVRASVARAGSSFLRFCFHHFFFSRLSWEARPAAVAHATSIHPHLNFFWTDSACV